MRDEFSILQEAIDGVLVNPRARQDHAYGEAQREVLSRENSAAAQREITSWDTYAPTPCESLDEIARSIRVATVLYKNEAGRFGLGSFKALGGAYAVGMVVAREVGRNVGSLTLQPADLHDPTYRRHAEAIHVVTASAGNHGRSVAWGAWRFGCRCTVYLDSSVTAERQEAIEHYGATCVRVAGNYGDAVRKCAEDADAHGAMVVSDTSYPGYRVIPCEVMRGYTVLAEEMLAQCGDELPTHLFVQGGVGGLAAAVCGYWWETLGERRPKFVVVEPAAADCLRRAAVAGHPVRAAGEARSMMGGLACGEASHAAWEILAQGTDAFVTLTESAVAPTMRLLADRCGIVTGESGAAGFAAIVGAAQQSALRNTLALTDASRVAVIGTEGATDPQRYAALVGRSPLDVARPLDD